jgi:hypothetical protein
VKPTGEEIAEADIEAAWAQTSMVAEATVTCGPRDSFVGTGGSTVDWRNAPVEELEQLDLFAAAA